MTEIKYALKYESIGEYLRKDWESQDAYTDDLGNAALFESKEDAKNRMIDGEVLVQVEIDEEGGMLEVSNDR